MLYIKPSTHSTSPGRFSYHDWFYCVYIGGTAMRSRRHGGHTWQDTEIFLCASLSNLNIGPLRGTQRGVPYLGMYGWGKGFTDLWVSLRKMTCHPRDGPFLSQWALLRERNPERGNCPCHHCFWRPWPFHLSHERESWG